MLLITACVRVRLLLVGGLHYKVYSENGWHLCVCVCLLVCVCVCENDAVSVPVYRKTNVSASMFLHACVCVYLFVED